MVTKPVSALRLLGDDDRGIRHQFVAPALAPPRHARGEIDRGIGLLPGRRHSVDRRVFVLGAIGTEMEGGAHASKLVTTVPSASARCGGCACRLLRWARCRAAGIRQSRRRPAAARGTPSEIRYCTTEIARADDNSQFDLNSGAVDRPHVGVAVDPQHPGDLARDLLVEIDQRGGELVEFGAAFGQQHRLAGVEEHFRLEHKAVADDRGYRGGCREWRAGGRRIPNGSATIPARAAPARRSGAGRDRRSAPAIPCRASRRLRALPRAPRAGGAAR